MSAHLVLLSLISLRPSFPSRKKQICASNNWCTVKIHIVIDLYIPNLPSLSLSAFISISIYVHLGVHIVIHHLSYLNYLFICLDNWQLPVVQLNICPFIHPAICSGKDPFSLVPTCSKPLAQPLVKGITEVSGEGLLSWAPRLLHLPIFHLPCQACVRHWGWQVLDQECPDKQGGGSQAGWPWEEEARVCVKGRGVGRTVSKPQFCSWVVSPLDLGPYQRLFLLPSLLLLALPGRKQQSVKQTKVTISSPPTPNIPGLPFPWWQVRLPWGSHQVSTGNTVVAFGVGIPQF